jgi:hypothetical protein
MMLIFFFLFFLVAVVKEWGMALAFAAPSILSAFIHYSILGVNMILESQFTM